MRGESFDLFKSKIVNKKIINKHVFEVWYSDERGLKRSHFWSILDVGHILESRAVESYKVTVPCHPHVHFVKVSSFIVRVGVGFFCMLGEKS